MDRGPWNLELGEPSPSGASDTDVDVDSTVSYSTGRGIRIYSLQCCSALSLYWLFATGAGRRPGLPRMSCLPMPFGELKVRAGRLEARFTREAKGPRCFLFVADSDGGHW